MSRAARSAIAAAVLLMVVGMLLPDGSERTTPTTFGTYPNGYRAVFELLHEAGFPVRRNFDPPARIAPESAVWWIEPAGLCATEDAPAIWDLGGMLEAGGTALVFPPPDCTRLGRMEIPEFSGGCGCGDGVRALALDILPAEFRSRRCFVGVRLSGGSVRDRDAASRGPILD